MIALIQRVREASVWVAGECVGSISHGILALVAIERGDNLEAASKLAERILRFRIFSDAEGKMNLGLKEVQGDLLLVSQFTLAADTQKGLRPSFAPAADPETARKLFDALKEILAQEPIKVSTGVFGADMQVHLINDGPVTFNLRVAPVNVA